MKTHTILSLFALFMLSLLFTGCTSYKQVGDLTMVSTRNVDTSADYVLIRSYMGGSNRELRKSRAVDLKDAINNVVRQTPGGEFLKNVKVYLINGKYFAVEGDIWGISENINFRGFRVGDRVQYRNQTYVILDLVNDRVCSIRHEETGRIIEVSYSDIRKVE
jgi:hypothetical protein